MSFSYREYVQDNPHGYWFKRKLYGWGWTPVRWQGWLAVGLYIASIFYLLRGLEDSSAYSANDVIVGMVIPVVILTTLLILVCFLKGERPRWQWGPDKGDKK